MADLTSTTTREAVRTEVERGFPSAKPARQINFTGQLHALRNRIAIGDVVALPLKTTGQIALGCVAGGYEYLAGEADPTRRHVVRVDWKRTDVPRNAIRQDLLYSLGAFLTICEISRNDGGWRLAQVLKTGIDPGARPGPGTSPTTLREQDPSDQTAEAIDLAQAAWDRIRTFVGEKYAGHALARLVAAILTAEGYMCEVASEGPDGGVDIVAGRGALGLDPPKIVVQVKSQTTQVGVEVVNQLLGGRARLHADQALLVAWGGITKPARAQAESQRFILRVWDAEALLSAMLRVYAHLPEEIHSEIPLKQTWVLVEQAGED
ncbi:restriction endonuclease [Micromonospora soli]|uniref:restriction endonuclease n=1 Tax=Micromonospora sp. NBRC 110009 TaxID=3061627 RepID=UPI0026740F25|nr:restriction endonuclease [Micromonospora sp. NBRC 110009]WKT98626.1 restriction endonuclease [Micromonospora sp. NBRC 110009]